MPINNPIVITITINSGNGSVVTETTNLGDEEMQNWQTRNSAYTMQNRERIIADTSEAALTLKLPALARYGDEVEIIIDGNNALTIDGNQAFIEGVNTPYAVTGDKTKIQAIYKDEVKGWVIAQSTTSTSTGGTTPTPTPTPQPTTGANLAYQSDGDTNDLFYWLGTSKKTSTWANPHVLGRVTVQSSTFLDGQSTLQSLVGLAGEHFHTLSGSNQWIQFVLPQGQTIALTRWTYQARDNSPLSVADRLLVSISNDGETFSPMQDVSFALGQNAYFTSPVVNFPDARIIRFIQPKSDYFTAGRFLLYGNLKGY